NDSDDAVIGTFNGLDEGKAFIAGLGTIASGYRITYHGGDGNDVVLTAVNTAPSFAVYNYLQITDESGPQVLSQWLTDISSGPPADVLQVLHFIVTNDNHDLFLEQPAINNG